MMAIDVRRVQLDSRQILTQLSTSHSPAAAGKRISATIDGILESCLETFGYEAKSWFSEIHWRPLSVLQHFYCLLFFRGKLFIVFPGHNSLRKLSKLFFWSYNLSFTMWKSLLAASENKSVKSSFGMDAE